MGCWLLAANSHLSGWLRLTAEGFSLGLTTIPDQFTGGVQANEVS